MYKRQTLLGRLCRFHLWEPNQFGIHKPLPHDAALAEHGPGIRRAFTYKALNRLIQGSAADQTKQAIVSCSHLGYTPLLQIQVELCFNVHEEDVKKIVKEMEGCVELNVPSVVDVALGNDFGSAT